MTLFLIDRGLYKNSNERVKDLEGFRSRRFGCERSSNKEQRKSGGEKEGVIGAVIADYCWLWWLCDREGSKKGASNLLLLLLPRPRPLSFFAYDREKIGKIDFHVISSSRESEKKKGIVIVARRVAFAAEQPNALVCCVRFIRFGGGFSARELTVDTVNVPRVLLGVSSEFLDVERYQ